ncbi:hypothetical protein [Saccharothrix obliqua]|uniref:hypothetical protein n=1 Tax=Saccharothrix obliqua TaxID=2861747 RepID=UPI001C5E8303|nr:hypothetical protein [Saccharothrix obliqua]MBW4721676.1 hypothetical protein [Saccharothrix obliqua]
MTTLDADTLDDLIDDCTALPAELRPTDQPRPAPPAAEPWQVTDACVAQVVGMDTYV